MARTEEAQAANLTTEFAAGLVTADELEAVARLMRKLSIGQARLTTGQQLMLPGVPQAQLAAARAALGLSGAVPAGHAGLAVQGCPGRELCQNGHQDTIAMAGLLADALAGLPLPAKVRVGLSGCARCCGESHVRDVGLVGTKSGWTVVFGGNAGARPRAADELASGLSSEEALELVSGALSHYAGEAKSRQRTARFVEERGIASVRRALGLDEEELENAPEEDGG